MLEPASERLPVDVRAAALREHDRHVLAQEPAHGPHRVPRVVRADERAGAVHDHRVRGVAEEHRGRLAARLVNAQHIDPGDHRAAAIWLHDDAVVRGEPAVQAHLRRLAAESDRGLMQV